MAAPVGRSKAKDAARPAALMSVPTIHPIASCRGSDDANITPMAAGMIRNEKTSNTPAIATELVTTTPKRRVEDEFPDERPRAASTCRRNSQCSSPTAAIDRNDDCNLIEAAGQDVTGQNLLEMLGALRRPVDQQNGRCRRNDVDRRRSMPLAERACAQDRVNASSTAASRVNASE